jgi:hypothetical protein
MMARNFASHHLMFSASRRSQNRLDCCLRIMTPTVSVDRERACDQTLFHSLIDHPLAGEPETNHLSIEDVEGLR